MIEHNSYSLDDAKILIRHDLQKLRRYALVLTGDQVVTDESIFSTLKLFLHKHRLTNDAYRARIKLYSCFSDIWQQKVAQQGKANTDQPEKLAVNRVPQLPQLQRQVFLLRTMENFSIANIAQILGKDQTEIIALLTEANHAITKALCTNVLIVNDQSASTTDRLVVEQTMKALGHNIVGVALNAPDAKTLAASTNPGLLVFDVYSVRIAQTIAEEILCGKSVAQICVAEDCSPADADPTITWHVIARPIDPTKLMSLTNYALFSMSKHNSV